MSDAQLIRERDKAIKQMATLEVEVWALGVQVVAQKERLRLADDLATAARGVLAGADPVYGLADALTAWDNVPGDDTQEPT